MLTLDYFEAALLLDIAAEGSDCSGAFVDGPDLAVAERLVDRGLARFIKHGTHSSLVKPTDVGRSLADQIRRSH